MHIVMFSMTPLYPDKSMGGAQKQLKKVALYLAQQGHDVKILCTRRHDVTEPFRWHENLQILPVYHFKQPYPEPYDTPVYNIAHAIQLTADYLATADVFYSHDGGLIFPYVYQDIPTVTSLRSILFAETLQSAFLFQGDALIVPSKYAADGWEQTVGRFFPEVKNRLHVIHNGLDFEHYRPADYSALADRLGVHPDEHDLILYPHRPDDAKGIRQTIQVAAKLVHKYHLTQIRVLVPQWIDTGVSAAVTEYYQQLRQEIADHDLTGHFIFHEWIDDNDMPAYYSMGRVILAIGRSIENAANTPSESIACGTLPVVANVGAYRDILGESPVPLVPYGDIDTVAARVADIIQHKETVSDTTLQWLHENFTQQRMVEAYAEIILNATKRTPMPYEHH
ncbi:MAG: glycosyltransferase family 4 protein, partial [Aggregatilineales bacterium]